MAVTVKRVEKESAFGKAGLVPGSRICSVNGNAIRDPIDFNYFSSEEKLAIEVEEDGRPNLIHVTRREGESPGITFQEMRPRACRSKCIFCFIDQLPHGLRKSLYIKDEDYRFSFLHGNFVTLANLRSGELERIANQHLSPLYVSVHSTNPDVRRKLLGLTGDADIMQKLLFLAERGIKLHCQVVICPGINDGSELERTIDDLIGLSPSIQSIGIVPVGITRFRKGLYPLAMVNKEGALHALDFAASCGARLRKLHGKNIVYAADELFHIAKKEAPAASYYDDFPQIENGIGLERRFIDLASQNHFGLPLKQGLARRLPTRTKPLRLTIVTGKLMSNTMKRCLELIPLQEDVKVNLLPVENNFFGSTVTVAGLLTGKDIAESLLSSGPGDMAMVPRTAVTSRGQFLDGMTVRELEKKTVIPIRVGFEHGKCKDSYCRHYW
ncbi:MAG: DUF512 domain-containing protein [Candidatus Eisenbacteria bacterium]|nr:DUF512 domain-containing protein [Candidatus Eisenbacteria bacterium]